MGDQSTQTIIGTSIKGAQTDVVEFLELKAVLEAETQTSLKVHNRRSQTHLSSTMKDPETYNRQKEVTIDELFSPDSRSFSNQPRTSSRRNVNNV